MNSAFPLPRLTTFTLLAVLLSLTSAGCSADRVPAKQGSRFEIIATTFPLAEFSRAVAGSRADVSLLIPPGIEPHSYEPTPKDITRIRSSRLFIYTGNDMEPWASGLLKESSSGQTVVAAGRALPGDADHADAHPWLDFAAAEEMLGAILDGFVKADPASADYYRTNADACRHRLRDLDRRFRETLGSCKKRVIVSGGHATFGRLARRYGLEYLPAYGPSPNADPSPKELVRLSRAVREHRLNYIFYEELLEPRVARTLAAETGTGLLLLHGAHNLSREEIENKATFFGIMEQNLANLGKGLECRNP